MKILCTMKIDPANKVQVKQDKDNSLFLDYYRKVNDKWELQQEKPIK